MLFLLSRCYSYLCPAGHSVGSKYFAQFCFYLKVSNTCNLPNLFCFFSIVFFCIVIFQSDSEMLPLTFTSRIYFAVHSFFFQHWYPAESPYFVATSNTFLVLMWNATRFILPSVSIFYSVSSIAFLCIQPFVHKFCNLFIMHSPPLFQVICWIALFESYNGNVISTFNIFLAGYGYFILSFVMCIQYFFSRPYLILIFCTLTHACLAAGRSVWARRCMCGSEVRSSAVRCHAAARWLNYQAAQVQ